MPNTINRVLLVAAPWGDHGYLKTALEESCEFEVHTVSDYGDALVYLNINQDLVNVCLLEFTIGAQTVFSFLQDLKEYRIRPLPMVVLRGDTERSRDGELIKLGIDTFWDNHRDGIETLLYSIKNAIYHHEHFMQLSVRSQQSTNFLGQIVHELKNPLNAIMGFARVGERLCAPEAGEKELRRLADCLTAISRNGDHLNVLIEELLHIAQLESGSFAIDYSLVNLSELLQESVENYLPMAEQHGIKLQATIDADLCLQADPKWLQQIFGNLLSNAIKYTEEGEVNVSAKAVTQDDQDLIAVEVRDSGIGIDPKDFPAVFSEYTKVHKNLNKQVDSTGLGLPIAKRLVEMHGGSIGVESVLGEGSTFTVMLPTHQD